MLSTVPRTVVIKVTEPLPLANTALAREMGLPLASHTVNFTGTVLPCLNTLVPSALIGGNMTCPFCPLQVPYPTVNEFVALLAE